MWLYTWLLANQDLRGGTLESWGSAACLLMDALQYMLALQHHAKCR